ncbi:glycosyltransferase family A protein [Pedobacter hartonius]|nr:glycosyltransferase family A protein [Pedobacter hartonius]
MNDFSRHKSSNHRVPLISCLCVTHQKPHLLARAIACFLSQSYPLKQLVLVYEDTDLATSLYVEELKAVADIKLIRANSANIKKTLGELRNIAVLEADGEYVCQWDDDDWYHCDRVFCQLQALQQSGKPASILERWLIFNEVENKIYYSHKRLWEGSIMCRKDIFLLRTYSAVSKGEDTAIIDFLNDHDYLSVLDAPHLYVYVYHSRNTWAIDHFEKIFEASTEMSRSFSRIIGHILNGNISPVRRSRYLERTTSLHADKYT